MWHAKQFLNKANIWVQQFPIIVSFLLLVILFSKCFSNCVSEIGLMVPTTFICDCFPGSVVQNSGAHYLQVGDMFQTPSEGVLQTEPYTDMFQTPRRGVLQTEPYVYYVFSYT